MNAQTPIGANQFLEQELDNRLERLEERFRGHAVTYNGPLIDGVDALFRAALEKRYSKGPKKRNLVVILTTTGGDIEVVRRIVDVMRRYYPRVDFIIPDHAFSAGTVLVLSGDNIYMDYYSRLGPIDPQTQSTDGSLKPALGYVARYNELIDKANAGTISSAELIILLRSFDQADLYQFEQFASQSVAMVEEWLTKYKLKHWKYTETRGLPVTNKMRKEVANGIAEQLNNSKLWQSHGHGISRTVLERKLKLKIEDFGADDELDKMVREYYTLFEDYMIKRDSFVVLHTLNDCIVIRR